MRTPEAVARWKEVMSEVGQDGLTGFERRAAKIRAAKAKKLQENPEYFKQWAQKVLSTLGEDGIKKRAQQNSLTKLRDKDHSRASQLKRFRSRVAYLSRKQDLSDLPNFHLWGKGFELDHKLSIVDAFTHGLSEDVVSHRANLRFIPTSENRRKSRSSVITADALLKEIA